MPKKSKRPEQTELAAVEWPGVGPVKDKELDGHCRDFINAKDAAATAKTDMANAEASIMTRMDQLGYVNYRVDDYIAKYAKGKSHIKVKKVKKEPKSKGYSIKFGSDIKGE